MELITTLIVILLVFLVIIYFNIETTADLTIIMIFSITVLYGGYKVSEASKATVSPNATVSLKCGEIDCIYKGKLTKKGDLYTLVTEDNKDVSFKAFNYISVDSNIAIKN